jgi:hypothetical protein
MPRRGKTVQREQKDRLPSFSLRPSGTQSPLIQPLGTEPPLIQPSGTQTPLSQPSDEQALAPLPLSQPQEATGSKQALAPMPFFTGHHPGTVKLLPPRKGKAISVVTMSSKEETTQLAQITTTQIDGRIGPKIVEDTAKHQARINDIVERQRNGTWDEVPHGMHIIVDSNGNKRLRRNAAVDATVKPVNYDGVGNNKESGTLLMLGRSKRTKSKSSSDDEGLGEGGSARGSTQR